MLSTVLTDYRSILILLYKLQRAHQYDYGWETLNTAEEVAHPFKFKWISEKSSRGECVRKHRNICIICLCMQKVADNNSSQHITLAYFKMKKFVLWNKRDYIALKSQTDYIYIYIYIYVCIYCVCVCLYVCVKYLKIIFDIPKLQFICFKLRIILLENTKL